MKKRIFTLILIAIMLLSFTSVSIADTRKYTKKDLQSLYDTVANYILKSEELLENTLTDHEDTICATTVLVAKKALLTESFSANDYDSIYRGLYNAFSMMSLATQRNNVMTNPKVMRLLKALSSIIANDDYYKIVDNETASSVKKIVETSIKYIDNPTSYAQDDIYAQISQFYITLQNVAEYKIEHFNSIYGIHAFEDILTTHWFYGAVEYAYGEGLFKGTSLSTFSPSTKMTRGMFLTVLARFAGVEKTADTAPFSDVDPAQYYAGPVMWAKESGILSWVENDYFEPDKPITREEMVTTMYNYCNYIAFDLSNISPAAEEDFPDLADASYFAKDPLRYAHAMKIISGYEDGSLRPLETASRAEVAQVFINLKNAIG